MNKEFFDQWTKTQEETLGRFTKDPLLLGPTRETSEKVLKNMKASLKFYGSLANFCLKFQGPSTTAMEELYNQTADMMKGEVSPGDDYKEFYKRWIETYEKTFDGFLGSEEFSADLGAFVGDFMDFKKGHEDLLEDQLKRMSIPTKGDLDAAFKDIYILKKKVKDMDSLRENVEGLSDDLVSTKNDLQKAKMEIVALKKKMETPSKKTSPSKK